MSNTKTNLDLKTIIDEYCKKGFGSLNKNDFEVWIFSQIIQGNFTNTQSVKVNSDYSLSQFLRIPESKVKRMRYESSLKYPIEPDYSILFIQYAKSAKYDKPQKDMVTMQIKDVAFRKYLEDQLNSMDKFSDSSFNSDLIKISKEDFIELFDKVCLTKVEREKVIKRLKENSHDTPSDKLKELGGTALKEVASKFAGDLGKQFIDFVGEGIADYFVKKETEKRAEKGSEKESEKEFKQ